MPGTDNSTRMIEAARVFYWGFTIVPAIYYAWLVSDFSFDFFAQDDSHALAYNYYFLSLLEGRHDVPMRVIGKEGHYAADGTAYMYYGIAPAVLRGIFYPFVNLETVPVTRLIIWLSTLISGLVILKTWFNMVKQLNLSSKRLEVFALLYGLLAAWFASALPIVVSNAAIYHEPIAIAHLCTMLSIHAYFRIIQTKNVSWYSFYTLVLSAAVALHSRPHVAVGLYAGLMLLSIWIIVQKINAKQEKLKVVTFIRYWLNHLQVMTGMFLLLLAGLAYIYITKTKVGAFTTIGLNEIQYAFLFFNAENADSIRQLGFRNDGIFNPLRIIPNLVVYLFNLQVVFQFLLELFGLTYIRIEGPSVPLYILWFPWFLLILARLDLFLRKGINTEIRVSIHQRAVLYILLGAVAIIALLILSYGTNTYRYKVELWPIFWVLSLVAAPYVLKNMGHLIDKMRKIVIVFVVYFIGYSYFLSFQTSTFYATVFNSPAIMPIEYCSMLVERVTDKSKLMEDICYFENSGE